MSRLTAFIVPLQRALAIAAIIAQGGIAVTGSIVRVTGSGLGCPTWPECVPGSIVPVEHPDVAALHQWVEFGNRTLFGVIGIITGLCLVAAVLNKPRRRRVITLAAIQVGGVLTQAVIGGATVRLGLVWWSVSVHFMVSMVLVWFAVLLLRSLSEGDGPARWLVPAGARGLQVVMAVVMYALLIAGTFVTAAGPHAGDSKTPRLDVPVPTLAQIHADLLFLFLGMLIAMGFFVRTKAYWVLVGVVVAQGALGMVQYWTGVPEVLVSLHVLGAGAVVVATAMLWTTSRERTHEVEVPKADDQALSKA